MNGSILNDIKKLLGIDPDYTDFDRDIIIGINSALMILAQLGVCEEGFYIQNDEDEWADLLDGESELELVKSYIHLKVRLMFDPPSGAVLESMKELIKEYEWRLNVKVDKPE